MLIVSYFQRLTVTLDMLMAILNQGLKDLGIEARAVRCFRFNLKSISLAS
jgi:hypothetical protein